MAIRRINEKRVKKFLGTDGETPLSAVAYWGHFDTCKLIAVAALAWVPWVPWNPWFFRRRFQNPWILRSYASNSVEMSSLKSN